MTSGTEVVIVMILVWKEFVQDVMFTVSNTVKQWVIGRCFRVSGPTVCNSLTDYLRESTLPLDVFRAIQRVKAKFHYAS